MCSGIEEKQTNKFPSGLVFHSAAPAVQERLRTRLQLHSFLALFWFLFAVPWYLWGLTLSEVLLQGVRESAYLADQSFLSGEIISLTSKCPFSCSGELCFQVLPCPSCYLRLNPYVL